MSNYLSLPISKINEMLKNKEIKVIDLVNEAFRKVEENKDLNCFITLNKEEAIKKAKELDNKEVDNLLFGIPIAIKDNIITKDLRTTAGSLMLDNFYPIYNAFVCDLIEQKNMIIIGKTNMDEFAMGSSNQTSYYGPVKNPINKKLVAGGSSGGSAACVSAGITPLALGSDTGGSIRQPSSFCGIVGLKPSYGRVSRYGLIAFASSLDQIGPMTRNVYENALLLNAICQKDERDLTNSATNEDFTRFIGKDISNLKIAIPSFYISDVIDKQILKQFNKTIELLKQNNVKVDVIDIKYIDEAVPLYQIIALGEASTNLARYDGIKYGYSAKDAKNIYEQYALTRNAFGEEVKRRIMIGSFLLSSTNASTYYNKALKIRESMKNAFDKVFEQYDLILGPTTTTLPYEIGENLSDPNKSFIDDILTIPVNMTGCCSMSLPIGISKESLPIGMQIIGNRFEEAKIYQLASFIEKNIGGKHE